MSKFSFLRPADFKFTWNTGFDIGGNPAGLILPAGDGAAPASPGAGTGFLPGVPIVFTKEVRTTSRAASTEVTYDLFDFSEAFGGTAIGRFLMFTDIFIAQGRDVALNNMFTKYPTEPASGANCELYVQHTNPGGRVGDGESSDPTTLFKWAGSSPIFNGIVTKYVDLGGTVTTALPMLVSPDSDGVNPVARKVQFRLKNTHGATTIPQAVYKIVIVMIVV